MTSTTKAGGSADLSQHSYLEQLLEEGVLLATGVAGVYGKSRLFEQVLHGFDGYVSDMGVDQKAEVFRFPPVINRKEFEKSDYLKSFPHLTGTVHGFRGTEREHADLVGSLERGDDWTQHFHSTDVVLTPAACYPVYPAAAGVLPAGGRLFDVQSYCFRYEPSDDPARMQMFRMHEYVRIGDPDQVRAFRDLWLGRAQDMLRAVGLESEAVVANDPFFGRGGAMLAANQRDQSLKFELVFPITSPDARTAVVSCNYHEDHFGAAFGISTAAGIPAHTGCVGFGLERITLALFKTHGLELTNWPAPVRTLLGV